MKELFATDKTEIKQGLNTIKNNTYSVNEKENTYKLYFWLRDITVTKWKSDYIIKIWQRIINTKTFKELQDNIISIVWLTQSEMDNAIEPKIDYKMKDKIIYKISNDYSYKKWGLIYYFNKKWDFVKQKIAY